MVDIFLGLDEVIVNVLQVCYVCEVVFLLCCDRWVGEWWCVISSLFVIFLSMSVLLLGAFLVGCDVVVGI